MDPNPRSKWTILPFIMKHLPLSIIVGNLLPYFDELLGNHYHRGSVVDGHYLWKSFRKLKNQDYRFPYLD